MNTNNNIIIKYIIVYTYSFWCAPLRYHFDRNNLIENNLIENNLIENNLIENNLIENNLIENNLIIIEQYVPLKIS